jgi:hypothetical protein
VRATVNWSERPARPSWFVCILKQSIEMRVQHVQVGNR